MHYAKPTVERFFTDNYYCDSTVKGDEATNIPFPYATFRSVLIFYKNAVRY